MLDGKELIRMKLEYILEMERADDSDNPVGMRERGYLLSSDFMIEFDQWLTQKKLIEENK